MQQLLITGFLLLITTIGFAESNIDPFENVNRSVYKFNQALDENILEPASKTYQKHIPKSAQKTVSNFFGNLSDVSTLSNQVLQFKPIESVTTLGRILINSTIGLGGLFDVASTINLTSEDEDFGQTMAVWGAESGPYVVLPLLGPSNIRDGAGVAVDTTSPSNLVNQLDFVGSAGANAINVIDKRIQLSPVVDFINKSDDPYATARSSYLQKRKFDIYDGDVPVEEEDF